MTKSIIQGKSKKRTTRGSIILLITLSTIIFSPLAYNAFVRNAKTLYYNRDYLKIKMLVDSVHIYSTSSAHSSSGPRIYELYDKNELLFSIVDPRETVFGRMFGDTLLIPQLLSYMETHHDSIWIWHHPKAQAIYAKEDVELDTTPYKQSAFFNFLGLILAIYGLFYLINQKRKSIKTKANEKK